MNLTIEVSSKPGKNSELYQTLQALLPTMRQENGCTSCRVCQDLDDDEVYFLLSDWDKQASFEGYVKSTSGIALLGAIKTLGKSTRIKLGSDGIWKGIETLMQIRRKA